MRITTPIVFVIYKRPVTTQRVFDAIRQAQPQQLLVVADGPKNSLEAADCQSTRAVLDGVDWDCEVVTNYADRNLGLRERVSSGLNWAFDRVGEAIILEDDCLPHPTFFRFCEELLQYYRNQPSVMHISGNNLLAGQYQPSASYYFSRYPHIWGWATWRRAWRLFDADMTVWAEASDKGHYLRAFNSRLERNFWRYSWNRVIRRQTDTWSQQWVFACLKHGGLSINPCVNLVANIGFGSAATHTRRRRWFTNLQAQAIEFPLCHPGEVSIDNAADRIAVRRGILNPPSGSYLIDALRLVAKHLKWSLAR